MVDPVLFATLRQYRAGVERCVGVCHGERFELLDAVTVAGCLPRRPI